MIKKRLSKILLSLCSILVIFLVKYSHSTETLAGSIKAISADDFVNSIGVVTHLSYTETPYAQNWDDNNPSYNLQELLSELGIRHIRDRMLSPSYSPVLSYAPVRFAQLYKNAGIKLTVLIDLKKDEILDHSPISGEVEFWSKGRFNINADLIHIADTIEAIEGPNEYDNPKYTPDKNWPTTLREYQRKLYNLVKQNDILASKPVLMPSLVRTDNCQKVGDLTDIIDKANIHSYPSYPYWRFPSATINWHLNNVKKCSEEQPIIATETGYTTVPGKLDEQTEAKYLPRLFAEYFSRGIERTFTYEFIDIPRHNGIQAHFGLIKAKSINEDEFTSYILNPKKSYYALKNLINLLNDSQWDSQNKSWGQPNFESRALNIEFFDKERSTHYLLLQKSDGNYYLLLWREIEAYNKRRGNFENDIDKLEIKVVDDLLSASQYSYDTNFNYVEKELQVSDNSITVKVPDSLTVIKIVPKLN
ncbi:MAG: hypothetical protein F6K41_03615 [Symploca sp. SIO3E6]|nr:hypothetical protein [Caldora sp. SIO3E6]